MDAWQKTHVAVVTSIANALYKYGSNNYSLAKHFKDICLMIQGIKEGFGVIRKLGYKITPVKFNYFRLPTFILAFVFKVIMDTRLAEITMAKHTIAARDEMQLLQREFDSLTIKADVKTPAIDALRPHLYRKV
jgi:2-dehydropantoate 2-reductase